MSAVPVEREEERAARMAWWREAKFGLFIHWGVYAVPAGVYKGEQIDGIGEWIMHRARIPVTEYKEYAKEFNPVEYDPEAWALLAKEAGMKYVVITSKHHDGFALFDTAVSDWDVVDATPYGKDLIGPLAEAVRRQGLKFGLYYSQAQDWTHPGGSKAGMADGDGWCEEHKGSFDRYLEEIAAPQLREILTKFRPDILWWDTPHLMTPERAERLFRIVQELSPGIITNNRLGGGYGGDFSTPEQYIPATGLNYDWETCMTMNRTWGYKSYDHDWKSTETLIRNLVDIVSKGGNYLLNVGPTARGTIPEPSVERLREIGRWMRQNGESIYGTTASPVRRPEWGRVTTKVADDVSTLYLHVFEWPGDGRINVPIANRPIGAVLLTDPSRSFEVAAGDDGVTVKLQGRAPDPIDSVVVLKIAGRPVALPYYVPQGEDGAVLFDPADAKLAGGRIRIESRGSELSLSAWTDSEDRAEWLFDVTKPGLFDVNVAYAAPAGTGLVAEVRKEGGGLVKRLEAGLEGTGGEREYRDASLGRVELPEAGHYALSLFPDASRWTPAKVKSAVLKAL